MTDRCRHEHDGRRPVCCWRSTWNGNNRCIWHADVTDKSKEELVNAIEKESREVKPDGNTGTTVVINGAKLEKATFPENADLSMWRLVDCNLTNANLLNATLNHAICHDTSFRDAELECAHIEFAKFHNADFRDADGWKIEAKEAEFIDATLTESEFHSIQAEEADFTNTDGEGAKFDPEEDVSADFTGATFDGVDMETVNFSDAILENVDAKPTEKKGRANFKNATLNGTTIRDGVFPKINLEDAEGERCDLKDSNLCQANLENIELKCGEISNVELDKADLKISTFSLLTIVEVSLDNSDLTGVEFDRCWIRKPDFQVVDSINEAEFSDSCCCDALFTGLTMKGIDFTGTRLNGSDFHNTTFRKCDESKDEVDLSEATARDVKFTDADLRAANVENADLTNSDFSGAMLPEPSKLAEANLSGTNLSGRDFSGADFSDARLRKADLRDTDLSNANLSNADLTGATLVQANLFDAKLVGTRFAGAIFANAQIDGKTDFGKYVCYDPRFTSSNSDGEAIERNETKAAGCYRTIDNLARDNSLQQRQSQAFVNRNEMHRRDCNKWGRRWISATFSKWVIRYGESYWRLLGWSGLFIVLSGVLYAAGLAQYETGESIPVSLSGGFDAISYSVLVFAGLGMDSIEPANWCGQTLVLLQSITGPILVAVLVFIVSRRASR